MANISINSGQTYFFARSQDNTFIMDSTDHSHATKQFGNSVIVSCSATPASADNFSLETHDLNGHMQLKRISTLATTTPLIQIDAPSSTLPNDGSVAISFNSRNQWTVGISQNASTVDCDFQITDSPNLVTSPRTSSQTAIAFSGNKEVFIPNLDAAAGTFPVEYNTTTREITYDSSTLRTKKNIANASSLLFDKVLELQPREFERKNSKSDNITTTGKFIGLIAEEAADVHPQFAKYAPNFDYDENGKRSENVINDDLVPGNIDWPAVTTALIGKVQQLETRLKILESNV